MGDGELAERDVGVRVVGERSCHLIPLQSETLEDGRVDGLSWEGFDDVALSKEAFDAEICGARCEGGRDGANLIALDVEDAKTNEIVEVGRKSSNEIVVTEADDFQEGEISEISWQSSVKTDSIELQFSDALVAADDTSPAVEARIAVEVCVASISPRSCQSPLSVTSDCGVEVLEGGDVGGECGTSSGGRKALELRLTPVEATLSVVEDLEFDTETVLLIVPASFKSEGFCHFDVAGDSERFDVRTSDDKGLTLNVDVVGLQSLNICGRDVTRDDGSATDQSSLGLVSVASVGEEGVANTEFTFGGRGDSTNGLCHDGVGDGGSKSCVESFTTERAVGGGVGVSASDDKVGREAREGVDVSQQVGDRRIVDRECVRRKNQELCDDRLIHFRVGVVSRIREDETH